MATKDTGGQRHTTRREQEVQEDVEQSTEEGRERREKLTDDVDAILDECRRVRQVLCPEGRPVTGRPDLRPAWRWQ